MVSRVSKEKKLSCKLKFCVKSYERKKQISSKRKAIIQLERICTEFSNER